MAIVTDSLTYLETYQAFERPPDNTTLYSLVPRGIRRFFLQTDTTAKPSTDEYDLFITATLPLNFAYSMRSFSLALTSDRAADFDADAVLRLTNHISGQPIGTQEFISVACQLVIPSANFDPQRIARGHATDISSFASPFWAVKGSQATFRLAVHDVNSNAAAAGFVNTHVEFYEYDLVQAQRYWVNSPIPTISR